MKNYRSIPTTLQTMRATSIFRTFTAILVGSVISVSVLHAGAVNGSNGSIIPVAVASKASSIGLDAQSASGIMSTLRHGLMVTTNRLGTPKGFFEGVFGDYTNTVDRKPDTTVTLVDPTAPSKAFVEQNSPNPATDATKIRYGLPGQTWVKITIHTMLGSTVKTIVNEPQRAGTYTIEFNVDDLQPGLYFYRLHTEYGVSTRRMTISS